jgi:signal transduction histidine kinase
MSHQLGLVVVCVALGGAAVLLAQRLGLMSSAVQIGRPPLHDFDIDVADEVSAELAMAVSHELRTPLSTVIGASEILLSEDAGELTGDQRRLLESLERNGRRLEALVDDLVMLFAVHANTGQETSEVRVADVVLTAWASQRHALAERRAMVQLSGHLQDIVVQGNAKQLQLAVGQVISNALKFSPGLARIDLTIELSGSDAVIRVSDQGVGIPASEHGRVFDSFYRGSASHKSSTRGMGLGLTITKAIVAAHRGTIELTSEEQGGTTVTIALPTFRVPE